MKYASRIPSLNGQSYFALDRWFYKMHSAGLLFHPDDAPETIKKVGSGERSFTDEECVELNRTIASLFEYHGDTVYECGLKYFHRAMGIAPNYAEQGE